MSQEAYFFRLGLFILSTMALTAASVIWLGAAAFFEPSALIETCFDESVQGLEVGAPVKYRGISIGSVVSVDNANHIYRNEISEEDRGGFGRYIVVTMKITAPHFFDEKTSRQKQRRINEAVERGFRVRLTMAGLTGGAFVNADFVDPERFPPIDLSWRPRYSYVPSAPSSLPRIVESAGGFFATLGSSELVANLDRLLVTLDQHLKSSDLPGLIERVGRVGEDLHRLLSDPALADVPADLSATASAVRRMAERIDVELPPTLGSFRSAAERVDSITRRTEELLDSEDVHSIVANTAALTSDLQVASADLPTTLAKLQRLLRRIDRVAAGAEGGLEGVVADLRRMAYHLEKLSGAIGSNASQTIFGDPPSRSPRR